MAYSWFKAFHIIAMVAWFAGLFYLPRLFVYHADQHINYHELNPNFQEFIDQANYNIEPSIRAVGEVMNSVYESQNS
jgi:uncharacterized membrane protein